MAKTPTGRNVHGERLIGICIAVVNTMFVLYAKHFNRDKLVRIYKLPNLRKILPIYFISIKSAWQKLSVI